MGLQAQTLKETIRGKFGEYQGTSETRVRGGKTTTVYRDKYGVVTGTSETRTNPLGKTTTIYRDKVWVAKDAIFGLGNTLPDGFTAATPLGQLAQGSMPG